MRNNKLGKAVEIGLATVAHGAGTDSLLSDLREAYAGREGATSYAGLHRGKQQGFELLLTRAREEMVAAMRKKVLASRIAKPSVDFTLNDLYGVPVHLAALKGNVVVLDFWATWCNPCKISFPFLKKVYDKYRTNPRVTFLAIDTWERQKDYAATVENAKKFQADKKYEWTVLIDGENEVVGKYNVEGIPTKFILGGDGSIAFMGVGFNGPDMEEELTQQIEILLTEIGEGSR
jgi:thiol-disulfide isomerase/thioredoxin